LRVLDKRIELIPTRVEAIDLAARSVTAGGERIDYDWLVLATEAQLEPEQVPGFENVHHLYDLEHAVELRHALR
jgi:sulfide:quinone oxidoreductase